MLIVHAQEGSPTPTLAQAKATYKHHDALLNRAYQQAKTIMPEVGFKSLQQDQRRWIGYRDFESKLSVDPDFWRYKDEIKTGYFTSHLDYWQTMNWLTQERTKILLYIVACHQGKKQPLTGRWRDGYGGEIQMVETQKAVAFSIEVVRAPTRHTGSLTGYAYHDLYRNIMAFSDRGKVYADESTREPAILIFNRKVDRLTVHGVNSHYYCGARAYFDNDYYRVDDLTEQEKARVIEVTEAVH